MSKISNRFSSTPAKASVIRRAPTSPFNIWESVSNGENGLAEPCVLENRYVVVIIWRTSYRLIRAPLQFAPIRDGCCSRFSVVVVLLRYLLICLNVLFIHSDEIALRLLPTQSFMRRKNSSLFSPIPSHQYDVWAQAGTVYAPNKCEILIVYLSSLFQIGVLENEKGFHKVLTRAVHDNATVCGQRILAKTISSACHHVRKFDRYWRFANYQNSLKCVPCESHSFQFRVSICFQNTVKNMTN